MDHCSVGLHAATLGMRQLAWAGVGLLVVRAAAAAAPPPDGLDPGNEPPGRLDPGNVRQALVTVALGAFALGVCFTCVCGAACWCASATISYDHDRGLNQEVDVGGGPFSARRLMSAFGAKKERSYARVRLNDDGAAGGDIEMTVT